MEVSWESGVSGRWSILTARFGVLFLSSLVFLGLGLA